MYTFVKQNKSLMIKKRVKGKYSVPLEVSIQMGVDAKMQGISKELLIEQILTKKYGAKKA